MSSKCLVAISHKRGKDSLVVDILRVGKVTDDGGFLGEREATPGAIKKFVNLVNRAPCKIVRYGMGDWTLRYQDVASKDVVGQTMRAFVDGNNVMLECRVKSRTSHRHAGFCVVAHVLSESSQYTATDIISIGHIVQFSDEACAVCNALAIGWIGQPDRFMLVCEDHHFDTQTTEDFLASIGELV